MTEQTPAAVEPTPGPQVPVLNLKSNLPWLKERITFLSHGGSVTYGTNIPESDVDIRGLFVPPPESEISILDQTEHVQQNDADADLHLMSLRAFLRLVIKQAPNVVEMLFVDPKFWLISGPIWTKIISARKALVSKKIFLSHLGAVRQLAGVIAKAKEMGDTPSLLKAQSHSLRLLMQLEEVLLTGEMLLLRPPEAGLLDIRIGRVSQEEIEVRITDMNDRCHKALGKSKLPQSVDVRFVDRLYNELMTGSWDYEIQMPVMGAWKALPMSFTNAKIVAKNFEQKE